MAEAFARAYGSDVLVAASAGLTPAISVADDTMRAMLDKGLDLRDHFPKSIRHLGRAQFDIVINMSGFDLPDSVGTSIRTWDVPDPVFLKFDEQSVTNSIPQNGFNGTYHTYANLFGVNIEFKF